MLITQFHLIAIKRWLHYVQQQQYPNTVDRDQGQHSVLLQAPPHALPHAGLMPLVWAAVGALVHLRIRWLKGNFSGQGGGSHATAYREQLLRRLLGPHLVSGTRSGASTPLMQSMPPSAPRTGEARRGTSGCAYLQHRADRHRKEDMVRHEVLPHPRHIPASTPCSTPWEAQQKSPLAAL